MNMILKNVNQSPQFFSYKIYPFIKKDFMYADGYPLYVHEAKEDKKILFIHGIEGAVLIWII